MHDMPRAAHSTPGWADTHSPPPPRKLCWLLGTSRIHAPAYRRRIEQLQLFGMACGAVWVGVTPQRHECRFGAEDVGEVFSGRVRQFHGIAAGREKHAEHQRQLDTALAVLVENYQRWWFPGIEPAVAPVTIDSENQGALAVRGPGAIPAACMTQTLLPSWVSCAVYLFSSRQRSNAHRIWPESVGVWVTPELSGAFLHLSSNPHPYYVKPPVPASFVTVNPQSVNPQTTTVAAACVLGSLFQTAQRPRSPAAAPKQCFGRHRAPPALRG